MPAEQQRPASPFALSPCHLVTLSPCHASRRLTRPGWVWLLIGVVVLGLGVGKNINLLALLGTLLLVVLFLNAVATGRRWPRQLRAQRRLDELLLAGTPCRVELGLHNPGGPPCEDIRIEDTALGQPLTWYLDRLPGQERRSCHGEVRLPGRGRHDWGALVASSGHPFGLVRYRVVLAEPAP